MFFTTFNPKKLLISSTLLFYQEEKKDCLTAVVFDFYKVVLTSNSDYTL